MLRARTLLISTAAIALLTLSGCSAASATGSKPASTKTASTKTATHAPTAQSTAVACSIMKESMADASAEVQGAMSTAMTDPAGATQKLQALATAMESGLEKVTNDKAHAAFQKADDSLTVMIDAANKGVADPASFDMTAYQATIADLQASFSAIGEVCA